MTATVQQLTSTAAVQHLCSKETTSLSLVTINSIQSVEKYRVKRNNKKTYRSGAWYVGQLDGTQRIGWGQFKWSNGGCYDGNYVENKRHGDGKYTWMDGSIYVGNFHNDLRHGYGELTWSTGESYRGQFFEDTRHGMGSYTWADGATYNGNFRENKKCGFGLLTLANGDLFEGVYKDDQKCGAGIYRYKPNGAQDVGLWKGNTLIRICSVVDGTFLFKHIADHYINAGNNISPNIKAAVSEITSKPCGPSSTFREQWVDALQEHFAVPPHFPLNDINSGIRSTSSEKGNLEKMSEEFLQAASVGDIQVLKGMIESELINVNVCEKTGYFALLAAAVNCHIEVLNYLLDVGANINQLTDEGLSCLSACHILLYAEQNYVENIAESMSKENLFNSVELEKKTETVINRNERKIILSIYEDIFKPYGDKSAKNVKVETIPPIRVSVSREENIDDLSRCTADDNQELVCKFDPWKLDFYHRSMDRVKEVDKINRTFKDIMLNPHMLSDKNIENIDLCSEYSRQGSSLSQNNYTSNFSQSSKLLSTTAASIMGYDGTVKPFDNECSMNLEAIKTRQTVGRLINRERRPHLLNTIDLLLSRGADPSSSSLPMPVLFYAVKSAEPTAVKRLLECKANTSSRLAHLKLCPLHISVALPCQQGVTITELILKHGANPNARDGYLNNDINLGRTALHIACSREDNYKYSRSIVALLLKYGADPDLLCFGNSALSLAIASGNDLIIDTLLQYKANVSLILTHGLGSILCASVSFQAERRRTPSKRMELIEKLINAGADLLTPVCISNKLPVGTVVDYAYHVYYQDRRISCTPYHALSSLERECYNARKEMLDKLATYLRDSIAVKECQLLQDDSKSQSPRKQQDLDINNNAPRKKPKTRKVFRNFYLDRVDSCGLGYITIKRPRRNTGTGSKSSSTTGFDIKKRFRYCNECGRSVGIRLAPCPRCREIFYCSKGCKVKLWNTRHREECAKITGVKSHTIDEHTGTAETLTKINNSEAKTKDTVTKKSKTRSSKNNKNTLKSSKDEPLNFLPQI